MVREFQISKQQMELLKEKHKGITVLIVLKALQFQKKRKKLALN